MKIGIIILIILLIGIGGYAVFHKNSTGQQVAAQTVQPTSAPQQSPQPSQGFGSKRFGNLPQGATPLFGQVTAVNGTTVTIQRQSRSNTGSSASIMTITLTSDTKYANGSQSDIQTGTRIAGYGTASSDGSITAEQITINPTFQGIGQRQNNQ